MKKNVAIIMGGYSSEFNISIQSGNMVYKYIKEVYNAYCIHILKNKWVCIIDGKTEYHINKSDFSITINQQKINFDCVFNIIHGTPGEDGIMQAYFSLLNIPQTSCNMYQAALTFNKRDTLSVLKSYQIPMAKSVFYNKGDAINTTEIAEKLGFPCFIKANKAGSSFGITKVYKEKDIIAAINNALQEDDEVLMESFLDGVEVSVSVITYKGKIKVLPITEIVCETDFFDYKAKYEGLSEEITPARIPETQKKEVIALAERIYKILNMTGFTRSEFIFHNGKPHFIEINTNPGLSEMSILPQQVNYAGISLTELFTDVIEETIRSF